MSVIYTSENSATLKDIKTLKFSCTSCFPYNIILVVSQPHWIRMHGGVYPRDKNLNFYACQRDIAIPYHGNSNRITTKLYGLSSVSKSDIVLVG